MVKGRAPEFLELFTAAASHHPDQAEGPWSVPGDPDDDYLVALAVASASLLVTGDGAIHHTEPTPPIEILTPREFITRLEAELASIAEGETRQ